MVRLLGASALALTMMTAAADAAHRRHHTTQAGFRHAHHARHPLAHRHYAFDRHRAQQGSSDRRYAIEQDPPRYRGDSRHDAMEGAYAAYDPQADRRYAYRRDPVERHTTVYDTPRLGGRPRAWCGWYARQIVGQDPGPAYNLARNWAHWGRPSGPGVGVVVVWSHHVGMITGRDANGQWIVKSGNDGHAVRERARSISGAIAFRAS
jgi:hypothetical protein